MNKVLMIGLCVGLLGCGAPVEPPARTTAPLPQVYMDTETVKAEVIVHDPFWGSVQRITDKERGIVCYSDFDGISCLPDSGAHLTAEDEHWRTLDHEETTALLDQIQ